MSDLSIVAAMGIPRNTCGCLIPVFKRDNDTCFQSGDSRVISLLYDQVKEDAHNGSAILFDSKKVDGSFTEDTLQGWDTNAIQFCLPAQLFYINETYFEEKKIHSLGKKSIQQIAVNENAGIELSLIEGNHYENAKQFENYSFYLFHHKGLFFFLKQLFKFSERAFTEEFLMRFRQSASSEKIEIDDQLFMLAEVMLNIAFDSDSIEQAIINYGMVLQKSTKSRNYDVWRVFAENKWKDVPIGFKRQSLAKYEALILPTEKIIIFPDYVNCTIPKDNVEGQ